MYEVINLALIAQEKESINMETVTKDLQMLQFTHRISYDNERMLVLCDALDSVASQKVWEAAGRRFPLAFYFDSESPGGQAVMKLYDSLTDQDRADIDLIPTKVGCRMALYINRDRNDLVGRFWSAMFPPDIQWASARLRGGRSREIEHITARVPEELILPALKKGKARDKIIYPDGAVYVTDGILRQIQREHEGELLRKVGKKKVPNRNYREGR